MNVQCDQKWSAMDSEKVIIKKYGSEQSGFTSFGFFHFLYEGFQVCYYQSFSIIFTASVHFICRKKIRKISKKIVFQGKSQLLLILQVQTYSYILRGR